MITYLGAKSGCHLKIELATSVSTTNLAVAFGGDVSTALLINEPDEGFGFLRWARVNVTQQAVQAEGGGADQVGRILDGLWWHSVQPGTLDVP